MGIEKIFSDRRGRPQTCARAHTRTRKRTRTSAHVRPRARLSARAKTYTGEPKGSRSLSIPLSLSLSIPLSALSHTHSFSRSVCIYLSICLCLCVCAREWIGHPRATHAGDQEEPAQHARQAHAAQVRSRGPPGTNTHTHAHAHSRARAHTHTHTGGRICSSPCLESHPTQVSGAASAAQVCPGLSRAAGQTLHGFRIFYHARGLSRAAVV